MTDTRHTPPREGLGAHLWGAVRNALTEEDPVAAARRAKLQAGQANGAADGARTAKATASTTTIAAPVLSPMAEALLAQVLAKPTAYTALTEKLAPLETIVVDERTRYQAAYALIRGSRTVDQVVQAIDMQHLQALDAEATRFAAQLQDKERSEIDARAQEAQALTARIDAGTQQVARLREELEARVRQAEEATARDGARLAQLEREIGAKRQELAGVQRQFDAAVQAVKASLADAKTIVLRHLA